MNNPFARAGASVRKTAGVFAQLSMKKGDMLWKRKRVLVCALLLAAQTRFCDGTLAAGAEGDTIKVTRIQTPSAPASDAVTCRSDHPLTAREGEETVRRIAAEEHFNADLAVAIARHESGFRMDRVSSAGAIGLMQLMPATARRFAVDICNPEDNVRGGVHFLKQLQKKYANPLYVLAAYNAGEDAVEQNRGIPLYPETVRYVSAIMTDLYGWQRFNDSPIAVATISRQRKTASAKPDKDSPDTWSQGFVLHVE